MSVAEFQTHLGNSVMSLLMSANVSGVYDKAFEWSMTRAFYILHWILTIILGTFGHISVQKVRSD